MSFASIRPARDADIAELYIINQAGVPGVGSLARDAFAELIGLGTTLVAESDESVLGFVLLFEPGSSYASPNFRWFEERLSELFGDGGFAYVDRIAVRPSGQNQGIGAALYAAAIETFEGTRAAICCEVNTLPPNPGSMRFHERLGFLEVGSHTFAPGEKAVAYLSRSL